MKSDISETGLSDYHNMMYSYLIKKFAKGKPETIFYRCFKNFDQNKCNDEMKKRRRISIELLNTKELLQEYHKAPSWDLSFSIFLSTIYF